MPTALIDFDGPIHAYTRGWHDGTAYDVPTPGARDGLAALEADGYDVVVFSSRDAAQIVHWLDIHGFPPYRVTNVKLPATFLLDDRAVTFDAASGWDASLETLRHRYPGPALS